SLCPVLPLLTLRQPQVLLLLLLLLFLRRNHSHHLLIISPSRLTHTHTHTHTHTSLHAMTPPDVLMSTANLHVTLHSASAPEPASTHTHTHTHTSTHTLGATQTRVIHLDAVKSTKTAETAVSRGQSARIATGNSRGE